MSSDWRHVELQAIAPITKGVTYRGADLGEGADGLVSITSIKPGGGFLGGGVRRFSGRCKSGHLLHRGDVVVALTDLTQTGSLIGSPALVPDLPGFERLVAAHHVGRANPADGVDRRFLCYRLAAPDFNLHAAAFATGTTVRQVRPSDLGRFSIRLPSLAEQRRIVGVLAALDDKVEVERWKGGRLDDLIRGIGGNLTRSGASAWPIGRLGDHYAVARGLSYTGAGLVDGRDGGLPLHNLNSVREGGGYKFGGIKYYAGPFKDRHVVQPGDLVVANTEQGFGELLIGYPAIIPSLFGEKGLYSHHLHRVTPINGTALSRYWLYVWLLDRSNHDLIVGYANGTTVNMLPVDALLDPLVAIPPAERVRDLDGLVDPLLAAVDASHREAAALAGLRDILLPKLVSGELRVPDSYDPDDVLGSVAEAAGIAAQ